MDRCDVLILGGGPAGSTCAAQLVAAGLEVCVMDRSEFPRDKVCAGWITPQIVESLALDLADYRRQHTLQEVEGFSCGLIGETPQAVHYGKPVSYAIRRCEFDDYLLRRCGARLRLGEPLRSAVRDAGGWLINDSLQARLLIGAGGHFCPVARLLGAELGRTETAIYAQEAEFRMTAQQRAACRVRADHPELYFCQDLAGYGWCVRKGDYLNIGLGRADPANLAQQVHAFSAWLTQTGRVELAAPLHCRGHAYLLHSQSRRQIVADACLLTGDAAGLAYAQSGEGIRPAVESALLAADVIQASQGDFSAQTLAGYRERVEKRLGRRFGEHPVSHPLWPQAQQAAARFLLRRKAFVRHILLDRYFLHRQLPALTSQMSRSRSYGL